jgi:hypothetical protein
MLATPGMPATDEVSEFVDRPPNRLASPLANDGLLDAGDGFGRCHLRDFDLDVHADIFRAVDVGLKIDVDTDVNLLELSGRVRNRSRRSDGRVQ